MEEYLDKFFAVTATSLYRVSTEKDEKLCPLVTKIGMREGKGNEVLVSGRLSNGHFVGVTTCGIVLFDKNEHVQRVEDVGFHFCGGHTSPLIALFLREEDARHCLRENNCTTLDPRWEEQTKEVLLAIGQNHPVFIISERTKLAFPVNLRS